MIVPVGGIGPRGVMRDLENPDLLVPPATDAGTLPNLKFSFSDTYMQLNHGCWSREVTVRQLPIATTLAGVNLALTRAVYVSYIGISKRNG
jgi:oxalate decarboxylase